MGASSRAAKVTQFRAARPDAVDPDLQIVPTDFSPAAAALPAGSVECSAEEEGLRTAVADGLQDVSLTYWRTGVLDLDGLLQHVRRALRHAYGVKGEAPPRDESYRLDVLNGVCREAERFWGDDEGGPLDVGRILGAALLHPWTSGLSSSLEPAPTARQPVVPQLLETPQPKVEAPAEKQARWDAEHEQAMAEARAEDPLFDVRDAAGMRVVEIGHRFLEAMESGPWLAQQLAEVLAEVPTWPATVEEAEARRSGAAPAPAPAPPLVPAAPPYDPNKEPDGGPETPAFRRNLAQENALTAFAMQWSNDPGGVDFPTFERVIATIREDWLQLRARAEA